jgi:hypothetical protein
MTKLYIYKENDCQEFETNNVLEFLKGYFKKWPRSACVYEDSISPNNKIDIRSAKDLDYIADIKTSVHVVVYPQGLVAIAVGFLIATGAAILLSMKSKKEKAERKVPSAGSPNNGLSARQNSERIEARIPEIFGKVRSVPDLVAPPYTIYKNNQQVELSLMVIGRGFYDVTDIRDGDTLVSTIAGSTVEVYSPSTVGVTPVPYITVGRPITETMVAAKRSNNVNGQKLLAPNAISISSDGRFVFFPDGRIEIDNELAPTEGKNKIFTPFFDVGDTLNINSGALAGNYIVADVSDTVIYLQDYALVSSFWATLSPGGAVQSAPRTLSGSADKSVGPFVFNSCNWIYANFVSESGLYKDNGEEQTSLRITVQIEIIEVNSSDVPFGPVYGFNTTLNGSSSGRSRVATTLQIPVALNRFQVKAKRLSNRDLTYEGTVNDEVIIESIYSADNVSYDGFTDVTFVKSRTFANAGNLAVRERKLNMLVHRRVVPRLSLGTYTLTASSDFADILFTMCLDPRLGNIPILELDPDLGSPQLLKLDLNNLQAARSAILSYFGSSKMLEFNHTFDDENLTFEEMVSIVCETVFCSAYRQGSRLKVFFEKENTVSKILFNHRNKLPGTEKRTFTFGRIKDKDGVEVKYKDTKDGAELSYYIPADQSALNPEVLDIGGLTNKLQAYFHAHRAWRKIQYKNSLIEFEATQESNLLIRGDRILVADNTRPETYDGEVLSQTGLTLRLSQEFDFESGASYTIFLQLPDATVQGIAITAGSYRDEVVLASPPSIPLAIGSNLYAACTYEIVKNSSTRKRVFLIEEKEPKDNFSSTLVAYNYDSRYYEKDKDFINGVVNSNGDLL